mmetsp:Transcript_403/g.41  ORF Transcript_403/g.41 Transcript_403/m.41 type:complete len:91 (-) Transcript_403:375-647(-)
MIFTLTPIIPYLKKTCLVAESMKSLLGYPVDTTYPALNFMVLALCYFNFPEIMTSQPLGPALSLITCLITELAASLMGMESNNLTFKAST